MKSTTSVAWRAFGLTALGCCLSAGQALAQGEGGNGNDVGIPTLGGFGLAALAGALSVGGAWMLSRRRGKDE